MTGLFDLTSQVAVVMGAAAGGRGERAAASLADHGAKLVVANQAECADDLRRTASRCTGGASSHACDVSDELSVRLLFDEVLERHGRADIVVNAAGVMLRKTVEENSLEKLERLVRLNLTGTWLVGRKAGRRLAVQGGGQIVNLISAYAEREGPVAEYAYYSSTRLANVRARWQMSLEADA